MDRSRVVALATGGLLALLFITVATAEPARIAERQPSLPWELPTLDLQSAVPTTTTPDGLQPTDVRPPRSWEIFTDLLQLALLIALIIVVARLLQRAWANRPRLRWARRPEANDFEPLDELAEAVVADAEAQMATLRSGEARNSIVACWLRLEAVVEDAGLEHDPALTSAELTAEVLARFDIDPAPADRLAALYREARFSAHPMSEPERAAAIVALEAIHDGLRRGRAREAAS